MRTLSQSFNDHLASGATTLCHCWRITRQDAAIEGHTDHDRRLTFDGVDFAPARGFTLSSLDQKADLAPGVVEATGLLPDDPDIAALIDAGAYDGARVDLYRVNWADPNQRLLLQVWRIGEVRRGRTEVRFELRGPADALARTAGRVYQHRCDAVLGDGRCTVDVAGAAYRAATSVVSADSRMRFAAADLSSFAEGWFAEGVARWLTGENAGRAMPVKRHLGDTIELARPMPADIQPADSVELTAGCDKRFETCRSKFANGVHFRGFPHMPGNDFVLTIPQPGEDRKGGKLG